MEIKKIWRYPLKGLSPEEMKEVRLEEGQTLPLDRAWAIENGEGKFDPEAPRHLPKVNFIMLMRNEKLAALDTRLDDRSHILTIRDRNGKELLQASLDQPQGRRQIEDFIASWVPREQLRGRPHIYRVPGHSFSDVKEKCLHIINMASLRELEKLAGRRLDPIRFRPNLLIEGPPAFAELDWIGQRLVQEDVRKESRPQETVTLHVFKLTERCLATNVDPQSGERDMQLPELLYEHFGHRNFGIYAMVEQGGLISCGNRFSLHKD